MSEPFLQAKLKTTVMLRLGRMFAVRMSATQTKSPVYWPTANKRLAFLKLTISLLAAASAGVAARG